MSPKRGRRRSLIIGFLSARLSAYLPFNSVGEHIQQFIPAAKARPLRRLVRRHHHRCPTGSPESTTLALSIS